MFGGGFNNVNQAGMGYQKPNPVLENWKKYLEQLMQLGLPQNYAMQLYNALAGMSGQDINAQVQGLNQILNSLQQLYTQANGNIQLQNGMVQAGKFIENLLQQAKSKMQPTGGFGGGFGNAGFGASTGFGNTAPTGLNNTGFGTAGFNNTTTTTTSANVGFGASFMEHTPSTSESNCSTEQPVTDKTIDEVPYDPEVIKDFKCEDPVVLPPVYDSRKERLFVILNRANKTFKYTVIKL